MNVQDVRPGFLLQANPKYLHPCKQYRLCRSIQAMNVYLIGHAKVIIRLGQKTCHYALSCHAWGRL